MAKILRSIGGGVRAVGPLTVVNALKNPSFDVDLSFWDPLNDLGSYVTLTRDPATKPAGSVASCRVDVSIGSASQPKFYGVTQLMDTPIHPGADYVLSVALYLPVDLPRSSGFVPTIQSVVSYYDPDMNFIQTNHQTLQDGFSTLGWVRASIIENDTFSDVPSNAQYVRAGVGVATVGSPIPAYTYYVADMLWSQSSDNTYIDGDFAGYVWAQDQYNSVTLQVGDPLGLNFFQTDDGSPTPVVY